MKPADLKIESTTQPRYGGQQCGIPNYNIKITHIPSGLVAQCSVERSQMQNRKIAIAMIERGLIEIGWVDS